MTDPFQNILQSGNPPLNAFPETSRYHRIPTATTVDSESKTIVYIKRRIIPFADKLSVINIHQVKEGDRLDNIAANHIGAPEQFWQIADANKAIKPEELTDTLGRELRITLPQGSGF